MLSLRLPGSKDGCGANLRPWHAVVRMSVWRSKPIAVPPELPSEWHGLARLPYLALWMLPVVLGLSLATFTAATGPGAAVHRFGLACCASPTRYGRPPP
jgi:hypothetical protein